MSKIPHFRQLTFNEVYIWLKDVFFLHSNNLIKHQQDYSNFTWRQSGMVVSSLAAHAQLNLSASLGRCKDCTENGQPCCAELVGERQKLKHSR